MKIGYDYFCFEQEYLFNFLKYVSINKMSIHRMKYRDGFYYCYCGIWNRHKIMKLDYIHYMGSIGIIKYILYFFTSACKIASCAAFLFSLIICSSIIFRVDIIGNQTMITEKMYNELEKKHIKEGYPLFSYKQLNDIFLGLKKKFIDDIEYMNIYQKGSVFFIEYTPKLNKKDVHYDMEPLYASKDGLIKSIQVNNGNVLVKVNDYVKKGDILVDNNILSTDGMMKSTFVSGNIYAYTFETLSSSCKYNNYNESDVFFYLLLKIRSQIPLNALIDKENVLQISKSNSKMKLSIQYTLIEDIACKGEKNEGSY